MTPEIDEITKMIEMLGNHLSTMQKTQSAPETVRSRDFQRVVRSYLKCFGEISKFGMLLPKVEVQGLSKLEVVSAIGSHNPLVSEHRNNLMQYLDKLRAEAEYELLELDVLGSGDGSLETDLIVYSPSQKQRLHDIVNRLRDAVNKCTWDTDDHKIRVVEKINKLQSEIDREISSFTRGLGRLVELGDAIGEFGKRIKPATDRLKDVTECMKIFKKENAQIAKTDNPLQIPDMTKNMEGE